MTAPFPPDADLPPGLDPSQLVPESGTGEVRKFIAEHWFNAAYACQMKGDLKTAVNYYERSISSHPTAEAWTFLGWTYSFMGHLDLAIDCCEKAIATDPTLGNPYNDIGAYLIMQHRFREAIPWLEQALTASRYDAPHYAHLNLGRALEGTGDWTAALRAYQRALDLVPDYAPARQHLVRLQARFN